MSIRARSATGDTAGLAADLPCFFLCRSTTCRSNGLVSREGSSVKDSAHGSATCPPVHAELHSDVTILFLDLVGYTSLSKRLSPLRTMQLLQRLYVMFDVVCQGYGGNVFKTDVVGDCE